MTYSIYAGHLCATQVGEQVLMIDEETLDGRWTIRQVRHTRNIVTPKVIFDVDHGLSRGLTKCLDLAPEAILTVK